MKKKKIFSQAFIEDMAGLKSVLGEQFGRYVRMEDALPKNWSRWSRAATTCFPGGLLFSLVFPPEVKRPFGAVCPAWWPDIDE